MSEEELEWWEEAARKWAKEHPTPRGVSMYGIVPENKPLPAEKVAENEYGENYPRKDEE